MYCYTLFKQTFRPLNNSYVFLHSNNTLHKLEQHQSINQRLYSTPSRSILRGAPDSGQAEKNSLENRHSLRGALDQLEGQSRLLDQPQKKNGSALSQSNNIDPSLVLSAEILKHRTAE